MFWKQWKFVATMATNLEHLLKLRSTDAIMSTHARIAHILKSPRTRYVLFAAVIVTDEFDGTPRFN